MKRYSLLILILSLYSCSKENGNASNSDVEVVREVLNYYSISAVDKFLFIVEPNMVPGDWFEGEIAREFTIDSIEAQKLAENINGIYNSDTIKLPPDIMFFEKQDHRRTLIQTHPKKYPRGISETAYCFFSPIGYNSNKTSALVSMCVRLAQNEGGNYLFYLKKNKTGSFEILKMYIYRGIF